jgi:FkbM family methyltransferase
VIVRAAVQSLLRRIGRRWPDLRLLEEIEFLRGRIESLRLTASPAEPDGEYSVKVPGAADERRLYRGGFNMAWVKEFGIEPKTILDIGSFDGGDSIRFKQGFPGVRVVAFEADPDCFAMLSRNAGPFGVECVHAAMCDNDGEANWYQSHDSRSRESGSQGSMYRHSPEYQQRYGFVQQSTVPIKVGGARVDSFCSKAGIAEIDIAQIDVEGAEYEVIVGFGAILPRLLYIEAMSSGGWIGARQISDLHRHLSRTGYLLAGEFFSDRLYIRSDVAVDLYRSGSEHKLIERA